MRAPWAQSLLRAWRWSRRGGALGDVLGGPPTPALVDGILLLDAACDAVEAQQEADAFRK